MPIQILLFHLFTGNVPGSAASIKLVRVLALEPSNVDVDENNLVLVVNCACTSIPITVSHGEDVEEGFVDVLMVVIENGETQVW